MNETPLLLDLSETVSRKAVRPVVLNVDEILHKHVEVSPMPPTRWMVSGFGGRRSGEVGTGVAIIALKHSDGYEVLLRFDDGKSDSFRPSDLFPA